MTKSELEECVKERNEYIDKLQHQINDALEQNRTLTAAVEKFYSKIERMRKAHANLLDLVTNADW